MTVWHCPDCGAELVEGLFRMWCPDELKSISFARLRGEES